MCFFAFLFHVNFVIRVYRLDRKPEDADKGVAKRALDGDYFRPVAARFEKALVGTFGPLA